MESTGCELNSTCLNCPYPTRDCPPFSPGSKKQLKPSRFIHIGFGNLVDQTRIIKVFKKASNQTQIESLEVFRQAGLLITMTANRRVKSIIQMDSGHFILCHLTPKDLGLLR